MHDAIESNSFKDWLMTEEDNNYYHISKDGEAVKNPTIRYNTSWMKIKPSNINENINLPSNLSIRGGKVFNFDSNHLICLPTNRSNIESDIENFVDYIHVYLAGTGSSPTGHHTANWWMYNSAQMNIPTISLSYQWGNYSDIEKNEYCRSATRFSAINNNNNNHSNSQQLLESYHNCIVFGGSNDMISVSENSCIISRIYDLIYYLRYNGPFKSYWSKLFNNDNELEYSKIIISGHSQGSGHACYLSKHRSLKRCILISGPQELLEDDNTNLSWLDEQYKTKEIYSFMHKTEEYTTDLIISNWKTIKQLYQNKDKDINECIFHINDYDESARMFYTSLPYNNKDNIILESNRPCHNSTIGDLFTPRDINNIPVYFNSIWKTLLR